MSTRNLHGRPLPGKKRRTVSSNDKLGVVIEVVPIADAVRHPLFGPHVADAIFGVWLVAMSAGPFRRGHHCFTCGELWRLDRVPHAAVLYSSPNANGGKIGLVCECCAARGVLAVGEMVKTVARDMLGITGLRGGLVTVPGGRA